MARKRRRSRRLAHPVAQATAVDWQGTDLAAALIAKEQRPGLIGLRDAALIAVMSDAARARLLVQGTRWRSGVAGRSTFG